MHIREIAAHAVGLRDRLHKAGVRAGQVVGVVAPNSMESIATLMALWSLDVTTWLCPLRESASRLNALAKSIGADLILGTSVLKAAGEKEALTLLNDVRYARAKTLINTSGSTGVPKFVEHDLAQHFISARGVNEVMDFCSTQRWLLSLPLYHVGGLAIVVRAIEADAGVVLPRISHSLDQSVLSEDITHISLVTTQLRRLLASPASEKLSTYRRVILGGGPVPSWLATSAAHLPLVSSYGATEMASMWSAGNIGSGQLLPQRELRIDENGEVLVRGPMLFRGYFAQAQSSPFDRDGFYKTSDLGKIDPQGNVHILGRRDNMFISGGENIHPQEIELALLNHPLVEEAIVVGVPDAVWGERPVAFVRLMDSKPINEGELKEYLNLMLPRFKIPYRFFDWPDQMLSGLKPSRAYIRQRAEGLLL